MTTKAAAKTAKKTINAINAIVAQSGAIAKPTAKPTAKPIAITVQTRKESAKALKSCAPLAAAMKVAGDETSAELLSRLPQNTVAFKVFSQNALGTAQLFSWFDDNRTLLTRTTKDGKLLLNMAGAYCAAFGISHNKEQDGPLKGYPFYKRFSNALQQWGKKRGGFEARPSGAITDAVGAYLTKKEKEDSALLSDSLVAWILKHEDILVRIKRALE